MNNEDWASSLLKGKTVKIFLAIFSCTTACLHLQVGAGIKQLLTSNLSGPRRLNWVNENTPPK